MSDATYPLVTEVGVRELRDHLSRYLGVVKAGREVIVTEHGSRIARLLPANRTPSALEALVVAGQAQLPTAKPRRHKRIKAAGPLSDIVIEQRGR